MNRQTERRWRSCYVVFPTEGESSDDVDFYSVPAGHWVKLDLVRIEAEAMQRLIFAPQGSDDAAICRLMRRFAQAGFRLRAKVERSRGPHIRR